MHQTDIFRLASHAGHLHQMTGSHVHNEVELNLVTQGSLTYLIGSQRVEIAAGTLAMFWGAIPHREVGWRGDAMLTWLTLPLERVLAWQLAFADDLLQGQVLTMVSTPLDAALFAQWNADINAPDAAERSGILWLELEAWCRRLAQRLTVPHRTGDIRYDDKAERMARFLMQHYDQNIRVRDAARTVALHPGYATTLFRNAYGMSLIAYLTRYRVAQAQRLLLMTDAGVAEIAFACGFQSISRFYEAFEAQCGQSPGRFRKNSSL